MRTRLLRTAALAAFALAAPLAAHAGDADAVHVEGAWIRVLPGSLPAGGYAVLRNDGDHAVRVVGADSPAYGQVMLHQSSESGGMSRMRMVEALVVPAHGRTELAPGGYHLMMMRAKAPVKPGGDVPVTLHFDDGSTLRADFRARPANASGPNG